MDDKATVLLDEEPYYAPRHNGFLRGAAAVGCGVIAALFLWAAFQTGLRHHYVQEQQTTPWGIFFWGEHWALRVAASWGAAAGAGYVTGLIARERGRTLGIVSVLPGMACWLAMAIVAWLGRLPWKVDLDFHVSIGNKLAASLLVLTILPIAAWGGNLGEQEGQVCGSHFDARRFSLFGIKWFHYFWLPFVVYLWFIQMIWAVFYGLEWMIKSWKSGLEIVSIVPFAFTIMIWGTLAIMATGAAKAYAVLAGFELIPTVRARAFAVLKYGVGSLFLAAILQFGIQLLQYWLANLLGYGNNE